MSNAVVIVAMPMRTDATAKHHAVVAQLTAAKAGSGTKTFNAEASSSNLPLNFNRLYSGTISRIDELGLTHFAMIHDDVCPESGWLDIALSEMNRVGADLIAAVVPFKDQTGRTSTALEGKDEWNPKTLLLRDCFQRTETFTDPKLLTNTGLMVVRLDREWSKKLFFRQHDRILEYAPGKFKAEIVTEDWDFSRQVRQAGGKVFATRKIPLYHGETQYHNLSAWGTMV